MRVPYGQSEWWCGVKLIRIALHTFKTLSPHAAAGINRHKSVIFRKFACHWVGMWLAVESQQFFLA